METVGIILAGGKGTRLNSEETQINKTALPFAGKAMILRAVELMEPLCEEIIVVVGAFRESVAKALTEKSITYVAQDQQLGTGHAVQMAQPELFDINPETVLIGYGDHMMFYTPQTLNQLIKKHAESGAAITLVTTIFTGIETPSWGRVVKNDNEEVQRIVEVKDATEAEKDIQELNAGFYVVSYKFLKDALPAIQPSTITGEYYLTDLIEMATKSNLSARTFLVPFDEVGVGVNTPEDLKNAEELFFERSQKLKLVA